MLNKGLTHCALFLDTLATSASILMFFTACPFQNCIIRFIFLKTFSLIVFNHQLLSPHHIAGNLFWLLHLESEFLYHIH